MRFIILIVTVLLAVGAGFVALKLSGGTGTPSTAGAPVVASEAGAAQNSDVATVNVMVARNDISLGTVLDSSMVDVQPWPKNLALDGFILSDSADAKVDGMIARGEFKAREPLMLSKLGKAGDASFLASALPEGMRAVTVAVDAVGGVAGFIFPGDHVDVVITHSVPQEAVARLFDDPRSPSSAGQKPTTAEVLLANVRVLAVNLRKPPKQQPQEGQQPAPEPVTVDAPTSITLELSQEDNKKLRLAEKNGLMTLALRSAKDGDNEVGNPVTLVDISRVEGRAGDAKGWRRTVEGNEGQSPVTDVTIIRGVKEDGPMARAGAQPNYQR